MNDKKITGMMFAYNFICKRKLWFFANGLGMEQGNEDIELGKSLEEKTYSRETKNIVINDQISIDFIKNDVICEIKKSKSEKQAAIYQIKYYLYVLKEQGFELTGVLKIPSIKYTEEVKISLEDIKFIEQQLATIKEIINSNKIPIDQDKKICSKCAYYEFCKI